MAKIYLVQSATDLVGANGYSMGLLEAGHSKVLVSFIDYMGKNKQSLINPNAKLTGRRIVKRAPTLNVRKK